MTKKIEAKHQDVSSSSSSDLFKRGNYSMLRLLMIISAAGADGIPTRKLLDEIGSHATYTQKIIYKAQKLGLIKRKLGEETGPGQFRPISNVLTDKGRQLLQSQFLLSAPKIPPG